MPLGSNNNKKTTKNKNKQTKQNTKTPVAAGLSKLGRRVDGRNVCITVFCRKMGRNGRICSLRQFNRHAHTHTHTHTHTHQLTDSGYFHHLRIPQCICIATWTNALSDGDETHAQKQTDTIKSRGKTNTRTESREEEEQNTQVTQVTMENTTAW